MDRATVQRKILNRVKIRILDEPNDRVITRNYVAHTFFKIRVNALCNL